MYLRLEMSGACIRVVDVSALVTRALLLPGALDTIAKLGVSGASNAGNVIQYAPQRRFGQLGEKLGGFKFGAAICMPGSIMSREPHPSTTRCALGVLPACSLSTRWLVASSGHLHTHPAARDPVSLQQLNGHHMRLTRTHYCYGMSTGALARRLDSLCELIHQ